MKTILLSSLIFLTGFICFAANDGHKLEFKIKGIKDTTIYMASYFGSKQYYKDTAQVDNNGYFVFEGKDALPGGIYSVVMPDKKSYFEFIVNDQHFSMETEKNFLIPRMKVKGSEENKKFYEYLGFISKQQVKAKPFRNQMKDTSLTKAEKDEVRKQLTKIDKEVKAYKQDMMDNNPDYLICKVFKTSQDPEIPETPILPNGRKDSTFAFRYFKAHYLDGVDFSDDRLLRSPVFHNKLDHYIKKLTMQMPDSIIKEADMLVAKSKDNKEIFKYVVHYITNGYERSKIMGMDAVFVHMADSYYATGLAHWVDSAGLAKITTRAKALRPLLVGKYAPNLILQDTTERNWIDVSKLDAKYTILFFWDPGCGHCKKSIPKFQKFYKKFKPLGVEIVAICTEFETADWKKFVIEKELNWINISDNPEINKNAAKYIRITTLQSLNFRDTYDIFSTPQVYLLDDQKKILAKKLGVQQLDDILSKKFDVERTIYPADKKHNKDKKDAKKTVKRCLK